MKKSDISETTGEKLRRSADQVTARRNREKHVTLTEVGEEDQQCMRMLANVIQSQDIRSPPVDTKWIDTNKSIPGRAPANQVANCGKRIQNVERSTRCVSRDSSVGSVEGSSLRRSEPHANILSRAYRRVPCFLSRKRSKDPYWCARQWRTEGVSTLEKWIVEERTCVDT